MKKIAVALFVGVLLNSMKVLSIESSHYDTSTQVLNIPNLVVKSKENESNLPLQYEDTTLLLNLDGTWKILNLDAKPSVFYPEQKTVAGYWIGQSSSFPGNICINGVADASWLRIGHYRISLMQYGDKLIGIVAGSAPCSIDTIGKLIGKIIGNEVSFSIEFKGETYAEFKGNVSDNFSKIEGSIEYKKPGTSYIGEKDGLSLSLH